MDEFQLNKLKNNLNDLNNDILKKNILQNYLKDINDSIKDLNELIEDIKNNNINELQNKQNELFIQKKTMEPFIKYLMIYNMFLNNIYN